MEPKKNYDYFVKIKPKEDKSTKELKPLEPCYLRRTAAKSIIKRKIYTARSSQSITIQFIIGFNKCLNAQQIKAILIKFKSDKGIINKDSAHIQPQATTYHL